MAKQRFIQVDVASRKRLRCLFGVTDMTISYALRYDKKRDNGTSRRIRHVAIKEMGGVQMMLAPECETLHIDGDMMLQVFDNGVELRCCKKTGSVDVVRDGKVLARYEDVTLSQLEGIQQKAAAM